MLTETNIQTLESLISLYKDEKHDINFNELSEEESVTALNYMLQLFDIDSPEFEAAYLKSGIYKYCNISAIRDIKQLRQPYDNIEEQKRLISRLVNYSIDGICFRKYVYSAVIDTILRLKLLYKYVDYVEKALEIVRDKTIANIILFLNTEVNEK